MSSAGCPYLAIERQSSVQSALGLACGFAAAVVPFFLPFGVGASLILSLLAVAISGVASWRAGWLNGRYRVEQAIWDVDGEWRLTMADRQIVRARLSPDSRVMPSLIWLHWRTPHGPRQMLLIRWQFARRSEQNAWRRAFVRLRLQGAAGMRESNEVESGADAS